MRNRNVSKALKRPIRRRESAPAAWLVLVTGLLMAAVGIVAGYWVWVRL